MAVAKKRGGRRPRRKALINIPFVIGLGSGGCRILSQISTRFGAKKIAVNNSLRDLEVLKGVDVKVLCGSGSGSGMSPDKGRDDFLEKAEKLIQLLRRLSTRQPPDLIPVIATLGHGFGSGGAPQLAKMLKRYFRDSVSIFWVTQPFDFEGPDVRDRAWSAAKEIVKAGAPVSFIYNQTMAQRLGVESMGIETIFHYINQRIGELLNSLFSALTATRGIVMSIDRQDLRKILVKDSIFFSNLKLGNMGELGENAIDSAFDEAPIEYGEGWIKPSKYHVLYVIDGPGSVKAEQFQEMNKALEARAIQVKEVKPLVINRSKKQIDFILGIGGIALP